MNKPTQNDVLYIFMTAFILIQCFILLFTESTLGFGGIENINNYQVASYSIKHPELFLSRFENPLYTMLLVPFAQFGYLISKAFNLLLAALTFIFTAEIVKRLYNQKFALAVVALSAFSPVYFQMSTSSLPEVLFGFLLVVAVYLFIRKKYLWSSLIISLITLVAPEGFVIIPVFAFAFILVKSYSAIPVLFSGTLIYSIAGYFTHDNFLLPFQNLTGEESQVGEGISYLPISEIGIILFSLSIAGLLIWVYEITRRRWSRDSNLLYFILIAGSLLVCSIVSYIWFSESQTEFNRVIGALIPLMALISLKTLEFIGRKIKEERIVAGILFGVVTGHVFLLFLNTDLLKKATPEEQLMARAASYLQYNEQGSRLYYSEPLLVHFLKQDPCNKLLTESYPVSIPPSADMEVNDVLIWDSKHGNDSAGLKLADLQNDSNLVMIKSYTTSESFYEGNEDDYEVHLYKKEISGNKNSEITDYYKSVLNFDDYQDKRVKDEQGIKAWELDSTQEYSPSIRISPGVVVKKNFYEITAMTYYQALQPIKTSEVLFVCSVELEGKSLYYNAKHLTSSAGEWEEFKLEVTIPSDVPNSASILVYLWNKGRKRLLLDEISIAIKSY